MPNDINLVEANGFLFIGDVHLSTRRPGTRTDKNYTEVILGKVQQSIEIANERRLVPVFLGDIYHRPEESSETLKTLLLRILNSSWTKPITNIGNHDMRGLRLSDSDTLSVLEESGAFIMNRDSAPLAEYFIEGRRIGIGATPYGQEIPREVETLFPKADGVVWITHHDLAFEGIYPGATEPFAITGCGLVVNGHMHLYKDPITKGDTMWCNFGSLTRTAIDAINQEPSVWSFSPETGLNRCEIDHQKKVFDLTGRLIDEISPGEVDVDDADISVFVELLEKDLEHGPEETSDGSLLLREIQSRFEKSETEKPLQLAINALFRQAVEEEQQEAA